MSFILFVLLFLLNCLEKNSIIYKTYWFDNILLFYQEIKEKLIEFGLKSKFCIYIFTYKRHNSTILYFKTIWFCLFSGI